MLCDRCNINQATIHLENNINGKIIIADLCPQCAQLLGLTPNGSLFEQLFGHNILGQHPNGQNLFSFSNPLQSGPLGLDVCPSCGTSFQEFQKTALFGCPECYKYFEPRLASIFKRVQAGQNHVGRKLGKAGKASETILPSDDAQAAVEKTLPLKEEKPAAGRDQAEISDFETLRKAQAEAVSQEDYERAAKIRDRIRVLQSQMVKRSPSEIALPNGAAEEGNATAGEQRPKKARPSRNTSKKKTDHTEDKEVQA